jgi:hypothetical protein
MLEKGVGDKSSEYVDNLAASASVKKLEKPSLGDGDESMLRPFGKAYYNHDSSYFVLPLPLILLITLAINLAIGTMQLR